ncbi:MAG: hypothetical protein R3E89_14620 [Thiolinea sp.]
MLPRHLLLSLLLLAIQTALSATGQPHDIPVEILERSPRDFGFLLGDVLQQRLRLTLPAETSLNPNTLPTPGRINHWLELRDFQHTRQGREHELTLTYQLFKQAPSAQTLTIPGNTLLLAGGATLTLPNWDISYSPLLAEPAGTRVLGQPALPTLHATRPLQYRLYLLLGGLGLCLLCWLWLTQRLPFLSRQPHSFTLALRQMRKPEQSPADCWQAFQQALSLRAGHSLFPDQLDNFFSQHPHYQSLQAPTRKLLEQAHHARFAPANPEQAADWPDKQALLQLCQQFSQLEQAVWRR